MSQPMYSLDQVAFAATQAKDLKKHMRAFDEDFQSKYLCAAVETAFEKLFDDHEKVIKSVSWNLPNRYSDWDCGIMPYFLIELYDTYYEEYLYLEEEEYGDFSAHLVLEHLNNICNCAHRLSDSCYINDNFPDCDINHLDSEQREALKKTLTDLIALFKNFEKVNLELIKPGHLGFEYTFEKGLVTSPKPL